LSDFICFEVDSEARPIKKRVRKVKEKEAVLRKEGSEAVEGAKNPEIEQDQA
jgi:hypothetical protein